jgi:hypothetical protein
LRP